MTTPVLRVKKLSELALLPSRGSALAAGFDLASAYDAVVPARGKALVKTDLAVAVPAGCYARVAPRSGLALKKFIDTGAGVIGVLCRVVVHPGIWRLRLTTELLGRRRLPRQRRRRALQPRGRGL